MIYPPPPLCSSTPTPRSLIPEPVEEHGALVELVSGVHQLGGDDRSVGEGRGLAADLLTVQHDVTPVGPDEERQALLKTIIDLKL